MEYEVSLRQTAGVLLYSATCTQASKPELSVECQPRCPQCLADIMVQEFVEHGALDLYLKREKSVSVSWKLDVAKQLASVLNFLVGQGCRGLMKQKRLNTWQGKFSGGLHDNLEQQKND